MKRVAELEHEPEAGKYYLVPCFVAQDKVIHVLGPKHEDADYIGFPNEHYHFDLRFLAYKHIWDRVSHFYNRKRGNCPVIAPEEFMMVVVTVEFPDLQLQERPMKCKRRMPTFPWETGVTLITWPSELEAAYADTKLACLRCPHRGFPLSADNADEHGNVVCPGHGLCFNLPTGRLVSRLK